MKTISSLELRNARKDFRESKNHKHLPEASLVGGKESTAMFTIAGMQQLIPYLSGKKHPLGKRLYNIQKCVRTVDIDEVGDASHLTFFHMMGNRSLGDYFKKESVQRSWEFLVDVLKFDPKKLAVTVFEGDDSAPRDDETPGYRTKIGIPDHKIAFMPAKNNRRSPGPIWPCGSDTEIFYRVGESEFPPKDSNPRSDEDHRLEIRNNVFMEFYRDESGKLTKLKEQNVDTWMGFERMCKVLQGKESIFETDLFRPMIEIITKDLGIKYTGNERRMRIIADHLRTGFFLIHDGITPSNEGRGYVLRRLIRRAYYNLILLKELSENENNSLIQEIIKRIGDNFEWTFDIKHIGEVITKETTQFQKTINNGQKLLTELFEHSKKTRSGAERKEKLAGEDVFKLYDTFGFPLELTREIAQEKWFTVDEEGFQRAMEAQQTRSRAGSKDMFKQGIDRSKYVAGIPPTKFIWYGKNNLSADKITLLKDFDVNWQRILIFDQSPFYAEGWGQVGDEWIYIAPNWEKLHIIDVKKYEWVFLHFVG